MTPPDVIRGRRWEQERAFFDAQARHSAAELRPFDTATVERYRNPGLLGSKEFRFRIMGPLAGKTILDVGCNDGENSVLMARLGATVVGVDLSPAAIELAKRRARINGVEHLTRFVAAPIEMVEFSEDSFDIVWCHSFLHHVLDDLSLVLRRLVCWAKSDAQIVISEPVSHLDVLRRVRRLVPVPMAGTDSERPLTTKEVVVVTDALAKPQRRDFRLFKRLARVLYPRGEEQASPLARRCALALGWTDYALLSMRAMRPLAGAVVLWGPPNKGVRSNRDTKL